MIPILNAICVRLCICVVCWQATNQAQINATWVAAQTLSFSCGFYCNGVSNPDYCAPGMDLGVYDVQLTSPWCTSPIPGGTEIPEWVVYQGNSLADGSGPVNAPALFTATPVTMPYRATFYAVLNTILIPALVVWWAIFVFAILLIVAACVMCIRKKQTTKESTYKPGKAV